MVSIFNKLDIQKLFQNLIELINEVLYKFANLCFILTLI